MGGLDINERKGGDKDDGADEPFRTAIYAGVALIGIGNFSKMLQTGGCRALH
jgi:hypothetical protein